MEQYFALVLVSLVAISSFHNCGAFIRPKRCSIEETTSIASPGFCATMYCKDYNGITLFIDPESTVSYYEDEAHCESLGAKIYIPETIEDNQFMFNFLKEVYQVNNNVEYIAYSVLPENGVWVWKDEQRITFDSGVYWKSADITSPLFCYFINLQSASFALKQTPCNYTTDHHICVFA